MRSGTELYLRLIFAGMVLTGCLQVCGCHQTVRVFGPSVLPAALAPDATDPEKADHAKKELPGIPFYNHYGVCTKETLWLEPQTTLTLTVTADGGKPVTQAITLNNRAFHDPTSTQGHDANTLVTDLKEVEGTHEGQKFCPANVTEDWGAVRDAYKVTPIDETSHAAIDADEANNILVRVSNTASVGTAVDYSRVYYLNSRSPLIGTGTVDAKLNPDGTLGEGSASVDDETLGDVLTAAATVGSGGLTAWSTVAAARIAGTASIQAAAATPGGGAQEAQNLGQTPKPKPPACEAKGGWPEVKDSVKYDFAVTPGGFKHDHKRVTPLEKENGQCVVSDFVIGGSYTVTPVSDDSKPDKNAIGVSGTITLPKGKDSASPKP
jgi:hypothetical protein